ncbi:MAG: outer rane efflux protein, partial [Proteobacteria bacterium]|nr:outer rane efflux protein [Pseudomonadota bacterium]
AQSAYDNWHNLRAAAERVDASANLTARAYALGEGGITDVLNARRQALEGRLAATVAQIDAVESRYRLLLDSHQLWPLDGHHDEEAEGVTPVKPMVTN